LARKRRAALGEVTKRDFENVARILCRHGAPEGMVRDLSDYFASQNKRFQAGRFEAATRKCRGA
jgi:hypothetical protein